MATVTGLTAARMQEIEDASIVDGDVVGGNLILTKHDGTQINAGSVIGPEGPEGPTGSDLDVITATAVLDVGIVNQIRAGRQLTATDFTNMGLSAPVGLWNLSNLNDSSGNGRNLLNKGSVPFDTGINGLATTAAKFVGSTTQALYISDTGANDPFRIKTGSWGCWFKTAKRGTAGDIMGKRSIATNLSWCLQINNVAPYSVLSYISMTGSDLFIANGVIDVCDDCWHFAVSTYDGSLLCLYVDGILNGTASVSGLIFSSTGPLNIGASSGDGSTASTSPHYGRVDEAFVTSDILSEDQIRNLYCAKITHALGAVPTRVSVNVHRRRKGPALVAGDFPTQPLRLHNFSAGSLADEGSDNVTLTNNNAAPAVASADGTAGNAFNFNGTNQTLSSTDTGLPAGTNARSYGCWFKTTSATNAALMTWGVGGIAATCVGIFTAASTGIIIARSMGDDMNGPFVADGRWHFAVVVEYNASGGTTDDGIKRKLYIDGRLVGTSLVIGNLTLGGANRFRVAGWPDGSGPIPAIIDTVFVCGYVLTPEAISTLYAKGSQSLGVSPKNPGDHMEKMTNTELLAIFDTLDSCHQVDLAVA